ncbi:uncharacterized protein LOC132699751 [Cylas formicarius]|uniref:uncharacterized protein LOC132699751 n=1 Tax=Cylas formicarius TaxID=197179 RepID=UPI0029589687|nr:uncharacterized protein LOC132699751 [Cylas formicarius]
MNLQLAIVFVVTFSFSNSSPCGSPSPYPQFLPVAVKVDYAPPPLTRIKHHGSSHNAFDFEKSSAPTIKDKDEKNEIPKKEDANLVVTSLTGNNKSEPINLLALSTLRDQNESQLPPKRLNNKARRRRVKPKDSKKLVINQNSNNYWSLKSINDKPAYEVLVTDKASVARDLKDTTESALITVQKMKT